MCTCDEDNEDEPIPNTEEVSFVTRFLGTLTCMIIILLLLSGVLMSWRVFVWSIEGVFN